jgi:acyl-CoA thioesterase-2
VLDLWTDLLDCLDLRVAGRRSDADNVTMFQGVTSHSVWFHRQFRTDRWLLLRQHSPVLAHGRCFGRGDVLAEDGTLVASYAQEALLRFRNGSESTST